MKKKKYDEVKRLAEDRDTRRKMAHQPSDTEDGTWRTPSYLENILVDFLETENAWKNPAKPPSRHNPGIKEIPQNFIGRVTVRQSSSDQLDYRIPHWLRLAK